MIDKIENPQLQRLTWLLHNYDGDVRSFNDWAKTLIEEFYQTTTNAELTFASVGNDQADAVHGLPVRSAVEVVKLQDRNELVLPFNDIQLPSRRTLGSLMIAEYAGDEGFLCIPRNLDLDDKLPTPGLFAYRDTPPILSMLRML